MCAWVGCVRVCVCVLSAVSNLTTDRERDKPGNTETLDVKHKGRKMQAWMRGM